MFQKKTNEHCSTHYVKFKYKIFVTIVRRYLKVDKQVLCLVASFNKTCIGRISIHGALLLQIGTTLKQLHKGIPHPCQ